MQPKPTPKRIRKYKPKVFTYSGLHWKIGKCPECGKRHQGLAGRVVKGREVVVCAFTSHHIDIQESLSQNIPWEKGVRIFTEGCDKVDCPRYRFCTLSKEDACLHLITGGRKDCRDCKRFGKKCEEYFRCWKRTMVKLGVNLNIGEWT